MSDADSSLSPLALAFLGDAVWELKVRQHLLQLGIRRPADLHRIAVRYVSADAQARLVAELANVFGEHEADVVRRGRNAKSGQGRRGSDVLSYRHSTGFEALVGYLFISGQQMRLDQVCTIALQRADDWKGRVQQ